ncbi:hypothetical protein PHET_12054 [Paragonimus heterotremus]|uniref:Superoxide dismutase copper/zinc binding domain-containing protein n=1 Tax=Paragonimus heterotremus TaxID=100268 RepID=A0A8J4SSX1_9TREM|nr:hypothetical protein PHET_12054 [Paragonimus heterotremus]
MQLVLWLCCVTVLCTAPVSACRASPRTPDLQAGVVTFQPPFGGQVFFTPTEGRRLRITGTVTGLPANSSLGVHVHEKGNLGNRCLDAGGHWNPFQR